MKILVLGSQSTDFVAITNIRPNVGETVEGVDFFTTFGGKGANQAVAASRLGSSVTMLGKIGDDNFGKEISKNLEKNGVDNSCVEVEIGKPSGAALITLADSDNSIIYVPGANGLVDADYVRRHEDSILKCDLAITQHEVCEEAVRELCKICSENHIKLVLNPAPYREVASDIMEMATYIVPNESECKLMYPDLTIEEACKKYPNKLIVTMGPKGVYFNDGDSSKLVETTKVDVVDTTGAGDTFIGGFSTGVANNLNIEDSIKLGNLAASQSVTKKGAQGGMPLLKDLKELEKFNPNWNL